MVPGDGGRIGAPGSLDSPRYANFFGGRAIELSVTATFALLPYTSACNHLTAFQSFVHLYLAVCSATWQIVGPAFVTLLSRQLAWWRIPFRLRRHNGPK